MNPIQLTLYVICSIFFGISLVFADNIITENKKEIAKTIAMEACGEGYQGMYRVANVINNRSEQWNMTPFEVVSQKNQFVGYTHKNREKRFLECKKESLRLANNINDLPDKTNGALYFKRPEEKRQKWHNELTVIWENHEFWK